MASQHNTEFLMQLVDLTKLFLYIVLEKRLLNCCQFVTFVLFFKVVISSVNLMGWALWRSFKTAHSCSAVLARTREAIS